MSGMNSLLDQFMTSSMSEHGGLHVIADRSSLYSSSVTEESHNTLIYCDSAKAVIDNNDESSLVVFLNNQPLRKVPISAINDIYEVDNSTVESTDLLNEVFNESFWNTANSLSEKLHHLWIKGYQTASANEASGEILEGQTPLLFKDTSSYIRVNGEVYERDKRGKFVKTLLAIDSIDEECDILTECRGFDFHSIEDRHIPLLQIDIYSLSGNGLMGDEYLKGKSRQLMENTAENSNKRTIYVIPHRKYLVQFDAVL